MGLRWFPALLTGIVLFYLNLVLTNLVSLRQRWYIETFHNESTWEPLHDTLFVDWIKGYNIEQYVSLALRDMVDVCTYGWVLLTVLVWFTFSRESLLPAKVICCQAVIVPVFSISQLLTIVPDSTPNCVNLYGIPNSTDFSWIFWKWPGRSCGNMLWSSDLAQLVIFVHIAVEMIPHRRHKWRYIVWFIGECWTFITVAFIFSSRYQYSMDVFITIIVVKLLITHPWIDHLSNYFFVRNGLYYQRAPTIEMRTSL